MKIIIRPAHNMGMTHAYMLKHEQGNDWGLWYSLCRTVTRRTFKLDAETGNTRPIECERCKRKYEKILEEG